MTLPCWSGLVATLLNLPQIKKAIPVIGRDREIERVMGSLRRQKNNPLILEVLVLARLPLLRVWLAHCFWQRS